jgi:hypothetical protein
MNEIIRNVKTKFTRDEWRHVAKIACPKLSDQDFERMWLEFVALKKTGKLKEWCEA